LRVGEGSKNKDRNPGLGPENSQKIFCKKWSASIYGDFLNIPKIIKNGGFGEFQKADLENWRASMALGQ